jgi:transposase InsO family protein
MCKILGIGRSSYYQWLEKNSGDSPPPPKKDELMDKIVEKYFECRQCYGSPRLAVELQKSGTKVSRITVAKKMKIKGLRARAYRRFKVSTTDSKHKEPIAENLLARNFYTEERGKVWVSDITYLHTKEGFLYLTVVVDLYDRKVVGWALSEGMATADTVLPAWRMALDNRPIQKGLIFHSDRGVQYACEAFRNALKSKGAVQSMSRKGDCWDNAVAESFFKSLKAEAINGFQLRSREMLKSEVFDYIEVWYNRKRRHSYIGNMNMLEKEIADGIIQKAAA